MTAEAAAPSAWSSVAPGSAWPAGSGRQPCWPCSSTLPWWASEGSARNLVEFFTLLALAQMWNLLAGYAGLVSIGQQAFIGVGAYSLYVLADQGGVHPFGAVALAGLVAAAISIPDGRPRLPAARRLLRDRHLGDRGGLPPARPERDRSRYRSRRRRRGDDHLGRDARSRPAGTRHVLARRSGQARARS